MSATKVNFKNKVFCSNPYGFLKVMDILKEYRKEEEAG